MKPVKVIVPLTVATITTAQIIELRWQLSRLRQNSYTRAIRKDCDEALKGNRACLEAVVVAWNKRRTDP